MSPACSPHQIYFASQLARNPAGVVKGLNPRSSVAISVVDLAMSLPKLIKVRVSALHATVTAVSCEVPWV